MSNADGEEVLFDLFVLLVVGSVLAVGGLIYLVVKAISGALNPAADLAEDDLK